MRLRKYLESINIAPIDLAMLVAEYDDPDLKHKKATELFLSALHELKPKPSWDWSPRRLSMRDASFESRLEALKNREDYPGWVICPSHLRFLMHSSSDHQLISRNVISLLDEWHYLALRSCVALQRIILRSSDS